VSSVEPPAAESQRIETSQQLALIHQAVASVARAHEKMPLTSKGEVSRPIAHLSESEVF